MVVSLLATFFIFVVLSSSVIYIGQEASVFNLQQMSFPTVLFTTLVLGLVAYVSILRVRLRNLTAEHDIDKYSSLHDALTGAANRRHFEQRFVELLDEKTPAYTLLMLDLDRFKPVNDLYGHAAGDALLQELTLGFKRLVKHNDLVARLGGDEFALLVSAGNQDAAKQIAIDILQYVKKYRLTWEGQRLGVGASIGLVYIDKPGLAAKVIMAASDEALYTAKETGRGTIFSAERADENDRFDQFVQVIGNTEPPSISARSHEPDDGQTQVLFAQQMTSLHASEGHERRRPHGARRRHEVAQWVYVEPAIQGDVIAPAKQMRELIGDAATCSDGGADFARWTMAMCISAASRMPQRLVDRTDFVIPLPARSLVVVPSLVEDLMRSNALALQPLRHMTFILHDISSVYDSPVLKHGLERLNASDANVGFELCAESVESLAPLRHINISEIHLGLEIIKKLRPGATENATLDALFAISDSFGATLVAPCVNSQEEVRQLSEKGVKRYAGPVLGDQQQLITVISDLAQQRGSALDINTHTHL